MSGRAAMSALGRSLDDQCERITGRFHADDRVEHLDEWLTGNAGSLLHHVDDVPLLPWHAGVNELTGPLLSRACPSIATDLDGSVLRCARYHSYDYHEHERMVRLPLAWSGMVKERWTVADRLAWCWERLTSTRHFAVDCTGGLVEWSHTNTFLSHIVHHDTEAGPSALMATRAMAAMWEVPPRAAASVTMGAIRTTTFNRTAYYRRVVLMEVTSDGVVEAVAKATRRRGDRRLVNRFQAAAAKTADAAEHGPVPRQYP